MTEENKHAFVQSMMEWRLGRGTAVQMDALIAGYGLFTLDSTIVSHTAPHRLHEVVPDSALMIFNERELEYLISGVPAINIVPVLIVVCDLTFESRVCAGRLEGAHNVRGLQCIL